MCADTSQCTVHIDYLRRTKTARYAPSYMVEQKKVEHFLFILHTVYMTNMQKANATYLQYRYN